MDEGWLRFVIEEYNFNYQNIYNEDINNYKFKHICDVIIIPDLSIRKIINGYDFKKMVPEYCGGIRPQGIKYLREFVENGGNIIFIGNSVRFALKYFDLPVQEFIPEKDNHYRVGGSILKLYLDKNHFQAKGKREEIAVLYRQHHPLLIAESKYTIGKFPEKDILLSGGIENEDVICNKAAFVQIPMGKGKVTLFCFVPYFRAQTRGTYKLLFNSLFTQAIK